MGIEKIRDKKKNKNKKHLYNQKKTIFPRRHDIKNSIIIFIEAKKCFFMRREFKIIEFKKSVI